MSLLVLGLSHHDAPLDLLERVSLDGAARRALVATLSRNEHIAEAVVVSTCNRTEVYVEAWPGTGEAGFREAAHQV